MSVGDSCFTFYARPGIDKSSCSDSDFIHGEGDTLGVLNVGLSNDQLAGDVRTV